MATRTAKTVGQLLAALTQAVEGATLEITFEDDEYTVSMGDFMACGPKLYAAIKQIGLEVVDETASSFDKLRDRVGA